MFAKNKFLKLNIPNSIEYLHLQIKNPDVDIDHYLHGSNPIFRKFIDDGLAELEKAAAENNHGDNKVLSENRFGKTISGKDPDYWMERLNALKVNDFKIK